MSAEPEYDRGADGPAARARRSRLVDIEGRARGSAQKGELIQALRVAGSLADDLRDRGKLNDRQYAAACRIGALHWAARLGQRVSGSYGEPGGRSLNHNDDLPGAEDEYHATMNVLSPPQQARVMALLAGQEPGWQLVALWDALERLADHWRLDYEADTYGGKVLYETS